MPVPGTKETILSLLGMLVGGFGKGALMAQMAGDKDVQDKKEAALKRKEALEDRAFEFLSAGYMDQTLPVGQREKFGQAISKALYGNLAGEEKVGPMSGFDFTQPYQMTPEENARQQMQDPTTFRMLGKEMLKGEDPNADLKTQKLQTEIERIKSQINVDNARVAALNRSKAVAQTDKDVVNALKTRIDTNIKKLAAYKRPRRGGYLPDYEKEVEEILADINEDLAVLERIVNKQTGGTDWSQFEVLNQ